MLDELKKLNYPGRKEDLIYFLQSIVGSKNLKASDIYVLCAHAPAGYQLRAEALINYCTCFGWILQRENIVVCAEIQSVVDNAARLNYYLIESSLEILFKYDVLTADMFIYDIHRHKVSFRNELLPLSYASIRNVLVSQEFLSVDREQKKTTFWVHPNFESMLAQFCKKSSTTLSLKQLQARLEADAIAGAKAESFVLKYERRRICNPVLQRQIKQISEIDVCAGYDIISYENDKFFLPTSIICASREDYRSKEKLYIVDGQHRIHAFCLLAKQNPARYEQIKDNEVSVIVLEQVGEEVEIDTFITINKTSKKVDTSLAYVLKNKINYRRASKDIGISKRE